MAKDQCVAVGALRALCHGNVAACAGLVFDKYGLAQRFAEFAGRRPRHNFRTAAWRKWNQQANRFGWLGGLRACWQGAGSGQGGGGLQGGAAVGVRGSSRHRLPFDGTGCQILYASLCTAGIGNFDHHRSKAVKMYKITYFVQNANF